MKVENNNKNERIIDPEQISKIDPYTISKIILLDGTILVVQKNMALIKEKSISQIQNNNDFGVSINIKLNQNSSNDNKAKNHFSYIEWDFPKSKNSNYSFYRNIHRDLKISKTDQKDSNNNVRDNIKESNINNKSNNYSFYESKHISKKNFGSDSKNIYGILIKNYDNYNYKEINDKDKTNIDNNINNKEKENKNQIQIINKIKEKDNGNEINNNKKNFIEENINNQEKKEEINNININVNNIDSNEKNQTPQKDKSKEPFNLKVSKEKLNFSEKIKLLKYSLFDYDSYCDSPRIKIDQNNNQENNGIKPLNIIINKSKNKNNDDINHQFNKLLTKFKKKKYLKNKSKDYNNYLTYKTYIKENNIYEGINPLKNIEQKNIKINMILII